MEVVLLKAVLSLLDNDYWQLPHLCDCSTMKIASMLIANVSETNFGMHFIVDMLLLRSATHDRMLTQTLIN